MTEPSSDAAEPEAPEASTRPPHRRLGVVLLAAAAVAGVGTATMWISPQLLDARPASPTPGVTDLSAVVTVTPSPQPTTTSVLTSGADLGKAVTFRTSTGSGRITITRATWSRAGQMAPPTGQQYVTVLVQIECLTGTLSISPLDLAAGETTLSPPAFGPAVTDPLPGATLTARHQLRGEVGFVAPADTTTISILDQRRLVLAQRKVPAP
ncbi:MAG: hypothetical protein K4304_03325 [Propionicimonas sp.]